jgi:hypothetical protein
VEFIIAVPSATVQRMRAFSQPRGRGPRPDTGDIASQLIAARFAADRTAAFVTPSWTPYWLTWMRTGRRSIGQ